MIRPRDVYKYITRERMQRYLQAIEYRVIGFRTPNIGEMYIPSAIYCGRDILTAQDVLKPPTERLIIAP
jgi:uncharacterized OB-fold protein